MEKNHNFILVLCSAEHTAEEEEVKKKIDVGGRHEFRSDGMASFFER